MVLSPQSLYKESGYDHKPSLFGPSMTFESNITNHSLYYSSNDFCQSADDADSFFPSIENDGLLSPFILMIDRGGCTFVTKVRNAQNLGATAVLIADNVCLCSDQECASEDLSSCEEQSPIMADDGSGSDIRIPSFLLWKPGADLIKSELINNNPVQLEITFGLPTPSDRVEYELWTIPTNEVSTFNFISHLHC